MSYDTHRKESFIGDEQAMVGHSVRYASANQHPISMGPKQGMLLVHVRCRAVHSADKCVRNGPNMMSYAMRGQNQARVKITLPIFSGAVSMHTHEVNRGA